MQIQIKKACLNDVKSIAPLFDAYRIFYGENSNIIACFNFLEERLTKSQSTIFIATLEEEIVGFTQLYPIFSSVSLANTWLLNDLFVIEKARQLGVAAALLNQAKEFGYSTNAKWLLLETGDNNFNAQKLYEKNGWIKQTDIFYQFALSS